jgi:hypothetical protein
MRAGIFFRRLSGWANQWGAQQWVFTLVAVYALHYLFVTSFVAGEVSDILRPFPRFPGYLYVGWDGALYRQLYENYDRYVWPPLYPFTLRLVTWFCGFQTHAFEKSAFILNLCSHAVIVWGVARYVRNDARLNGVAPWLVAFLLFFYPGHNVFFAAYSESLYLALTIICFLLRQKERIGWASLLAGISSLVRMMGSFLAVAFFAEQVFYCLRDRKIYWRKLLLSGLGLFVVLGWHATLRTFGTTAVTSNAGWLEDLLANHIPVGANPYLWVLRYLTFSDRFLELGAFWISMVAALYCLLKRRYAELFYIAAFNLSLAFYLYRPFGWTRYVSVFFPIQIMLADWLKNRPRLTAVVLTASVGMCYFIQRELFAGRLGEP